MTQRIEGLRESEAPLWIRLFYAIQRRRFGQVLEPTRVWARAPAALRGFVHLVTAVDRAGSPIEPPLRSLIMVKVSQINTCDFCIDMNTATLQERGVELEKALALGDHATSPLFTTRERTALDYAAAMSRTPPSVDDATLARLREHFDDDAIVELTALVALQNASARFNAALAIPAQGLCVVAKTSAP